MLRQTNQQRKRPNRCKARAMMKWACSPAYCYSGANCGRFSSDVSKQRYQTDKRKHKDFLSVISAATTRTHPDDCATSKDPVFRPFIELKLYPHRPLDRWCTQSAESDQLCGKSPRMEARFMKLGDQLIEQNEDSLTKSRGKRRNAAKKKETGKPPKLRNA